MNLEQQILNQIIHNDDYGRAVLPFLKEDYFSDRTSKLIFNIVKDFITKYNNVPTINALRIELDTKPLEADAFEQANDFVTDIAPSQPVDRQWLLDQTEKYCTERAIENALRESILILDDDKRENGEISHVLSDALAVSFDTEIGHGVFADAEARYDKLHSSTVKIPFALDTLNRVTKGGVDKKTLNIIMAGCTHPDTTEVLAKYSHEGIDRIKTMTLRELTVIVDAGTPIHVDSPDGWVRVVEWVNKGLYPEYVVVTESGVQLECNEDHLLKTYHGWESVGILEQLASHNSAPIAIETINGFEPARFKKTDNIIPIFDIVLESDNHQYYTNGIVSHNTNVGKSLMMCDFAASNVLAGMKVLYITCEMAEERIAQRIEANLLDINLDDYDRMPKAWYLKKIEEVKAKTTGEIKIKEYPSNSAHVGNFRHLLHELKLKENFIPDVIYVDYVNIVASERFKPGNTPKHQLVQAVAEELRSLAQRFNVPVFSATQTNRAGFNDSDADITNVAEAWGLPATADWFIIVLQPENMEAMGQFLVKQEKSRYDDKSKMRQFIIGVDKGKMRLFDIDEQPYLAGNANSAPMALPESSKKQNEFFDGVK